MEIRQRDGEFLVRRGPATKARQRACRRLALVGAPILHAVAALITNCTRYMRACASQQNLGSAANSGASCAITVRRAIFGGRSIVALAPSREFGSGDRLGEVDRRPALLRNESGKLPALEVDDLAHVTPPRVPLSNTGNHYSHQTVLTCRDLQCCWEGANQKCCSFGGTRNLWQHGHNQAVRGLKRN